MSNAALKPPARRPSRPAHSGYRVAIAVLALCLLPALLVLGQSPPTADSPSTTKDRVNTQRWWPTKGAVPFELFAGDGACSECHSKKTSSQLTTPMAQAAVHLAPRAPTPEIVAGTLQLGPYLYRIASDQLGSRLAVSSGKQALTASIAWVFGAGVHIGWITGVIMFTIPCIIFGVLGLAGGASTVVALSRAAGEGLLRRAREGRGSR